MAAPTAQARTDAAPTAGPTAPSSLPDGPLAAPAAGPGALRARRAVSADLPGLAALDAACFEPDGRWSLEAWRGELESGTAAVWAVTRTQRAWQDGCQAFEELVAAACVHAVGDDAELFRVLTAPACRGLGLATLLLGAGMQWAAQQGATRMLLEVRHDNATARSLYADLGFRELFRRTNYYAFGADAIVMARPLGTAPVPPDGMAPTVPAPPPAAGGGVGDTTRLGGLWAELRGTAPGTPGDATPGDATPGDAAPAPSGAGSPGAAPTSQPDGQPGRPPASAAPPHGGVQRHEEEGIA